MIGKSTYNAVLMEIHMPIMYGFESTGKIREKGASENYLPPTAIIAMTANNEKIDYEIY